MMQRIEEPAMKQIPVAVGLHLCEQVIVESGTHNVTLVNCFTFRRVRELPAAIPLVVVAFLADGLGEMSGELVISRLDDLEEIYRIAGKVRFATPLRVVRFVVRLRDCWFPGEGTYQVSLLIDGEPIAQRRLIVAQEKS